MKSSLLYLTIISTIYSTSSLAMDDVESDNEHPSPTVVRTVPRDLEAQTVINLNEDVPGCVDNYFRCSIGCWQISEGWIDLGVTITIGASTFLTGLSTLGSLDPATRTSIGIAAVVCGGSATFLSSLKVYSLKAIADRKNSLRTVILQARQTPTNIATQ